MVETLKETGGWYEAVLYRQRVSQAKSLFFEEGTPTARLIEAMKLKAVISA
jgi:hypothetical protein